MLLKEIIYQKLFHGFSKLLSQFDYKRLITSHLIKTFLLLVCLNIFSVMSAQDNTSVQKLKNEISLKFKEIKGTFAIGFFDLNTGNNFNINGDSIFHAASTMKTPVMIEVFRQAHDGIIKLNDSILVKNQFKSIVDGSQFTLNPGDDSDSGLYQLIGQKETIYDLVYRMIIYSSNLATNLIVELVGPGNVMKTIRKAGTTKMMVLRGVEDQKAYDKGLNNVTTVNDLMILFKKIATGKLISTAACRSMIKILEDQKHNNIIPALLPDNVRIAHKTGNINGVEHDGGIIYLPDGRKYVLVMLSKNIEERDKAIQMMAEVSRMVYDFVTGQRK